MKGRISEIFESIQGEGLYLGERQVFVRFFGCNLKCKFCDTDLNIFREYELKELIQQLKQYKKSYSSISFTGGEPLLQEHFLKEVLKLTHQEGFKNYLETNGTLPEALEEVIDYVDTVAMDFKLPSSTGDLPCWKAHQRFLQIANSKETFVKMVICDSTELADFVQALNLIKEVDSGIIIVLQPNSYEESVGLYQKIRYFQKICQDNLLISCIVPQMHKIIGVK